MRRMVSGLGPQLNGNFRGMGMGRAGGPVWRQKVKSW